jgi:pimeloyl-ACP methyl ester carboxylesterase
MDTAFTPAHRGGSGPPLLLLHGFMDTWRTWELVLPALERRHDVLALTLAGHAGGPPLDGPAGAAAVLAPVERALDAAGWDTAHIAGNSLGGWLALQLAARGRARSVVALAPAGGWAADDPAPAQLLRFQAELYGQVAASAAHAEAIAATPEGRRRATELTVTDGSDLPPELVAANIRGVAGCTAAHALTEAAARDGWDLDAERVTCPVRIVWGTADRLLPWPSAAVRYRRDRLPHADWVELDGVGHAPQLEVPLETAQLILGRTAA